MLKDVIFALFIREIKTRFGAYRLGLVWAFLEPMSFVIVHIRHSISQQWRIIVWWGNHGIPYPIFLMLGYVPFMLFSKLLTQGAAAVSANQGLFNYRQVRPIDTILARTLLEVLFISGVILIFMTVILVVWF